MLINLQDLINTDVNLAGEILRILAYQNRLGGYDTKIPFTSRVKELEETVKDLPKKLVYNIFGSRYQEYPEDLFEIESVRLYNLDDEFMVISHSDGDATLAFVNERVILLNTDAKKPNWYKVDNESLLPTLTQEKG